MTFFYESDEDLALRGSGCLATDASSFASMENITNMDIIDFIEANWMTESSDEPEYRDERDNSERLADRHSC